jgi:hypothetical protein
MTVLWVVPFDYFRYRPPPPPSSLYLPVVLRVSRYVCCVCSWLVVVVSFAYSAFFLFKNIQLHLQLPLQPDYKLPENAVVRKQE